MNKSIIGLENIKDEFRKLKLKFGDFRGLKNKFELAEKFEINTLQIFYYSNIPQKNEITATIYIEKIKEKKRRYIFYMHI